MKLFGDSAAELRLRVEAPVLGSIKYRAEIK